MTRILKPTLLIHAIVSVALGALLLAMPGRFLLWLGWSPIDPITARLLGAALLALAWGDFRGWRQPAKSDITLLVEVQLAFSALGGIGVLRHLVTGAWPAMVWIVFGVLALFTIAWVVTLLDRQP